MDDDSPLTSSLWFLPVAFWVGAIWLYHSWKHLLSIHYPDPGLVLARWPWPKHSIRSGIGDIILLIPPISLILILCISLGSSRVRARADSETDGRIVKVQRGVRTLLWAWALVFPAPLLVLFAIRPDLVGPISEMVRAMSGH